MAEPLILRCSQCGANNRVSREKMGNGRQPVCGKCKAPLSLAVHAVSISDATFLSDVESSPVPVLLDMWAPWCGPCRTIAPVIEQLASEMAGRVFVGKLNVDDNPGTAARFGVQSIPTLLILKGGREIDRIVGVQPKAEILRRLEQVIG